MMGMWQGDDSLDLLYQIHERTEDTRLMNGFDCCCGRFFPPGCIYRSIIIRRFIDPFSFLHRGVHPYPFMITRVMIYFMFQSVSFILIGMNINGSFI